MAKQKETVGPDVGIIKAWDAEQKAFLEEQRKKLVETQCQLEEKDVEIKELKARKPKDEGKDDTIEKLEAALGASQSQADQRARMIESQSKEITTLKQQIDALITERQDLRLKLGVKEQLLARAENEAAPLKTLKRRLDEFAPSWEWALKKAIGEYRGGGHSSHAGAALTDVIEGLRILGYVK